MILAICCVFIIWAFKSSFHMTTSSLHTIFTFAYIYYLYTILTERARKCNNFHRSGNFIVKYQTVLSPDGQKESWLDEENWFSDQTVQDRRVMSTKKQKKHKHLLHHPASIPARKWWWDLSLACHREQPGSCRLGKNWTVICEQLMPSLLSPWRLKGIVSGRGGSILDLL